MNAFNRLLFGFRINDEEEQKSADKEVVRSFVPPTNEDGALDVNYLSTFGGISAYQFDIDGSTKTENELINKYRDIANIADVDLAVEDIVAEAIVFDDNQVSVSINFLDPDDGLDDDLGFKPRAEYMDPEADPEINPDDNEEAVDASVKDKLAKKPKKKVDSLQEAFKNSESGDSTEKSGKKKYDYANTGIPDSLQEKIEEEFRGIMNLLQFKTKGHDIFKRWYIDGKIFYHILIDEKDPSSGIKDLRFVDPRKLKKVRENRSAPNQTRAGSNAKARDGFDLPLKEDYVEYYLYSDQFFTGNTQDNNAAFGGNRPDSSKNNIQALKIATDSIATANSGIIDSRSHIVLSYLHKAIRPANHLKMMEDALVIYRLTRASEKRVYNVDIQDLPRGRAEQYMNEFMNRYRNKITYDVETGEIRDQKRVMSMIEDFFIPRRNGAQGTSIDILPGGQNLSQIDDVEYFLKKLYKALNVPAGRLMNDGPVGLGRTNEVTREELKYSQFIDKVRSRFSMLFDDLLRKQLILKNIISPDEWEEISQVIKYNYIRNNFFTELKEAEVLRERLGLLQQIAPFEHRYFDDEFIMKKVLRFNSQEIRAVQEMRKKYPMPPLNVDPYGNPMQGDPNSMPQGGFPGMPPQQDPNAGYGPDNGDKEDIQEEEQNRQLNQLLEALAEESRKRSSNDLI